MDISIIICTYNRSHNLAECFSCLEQQKFTNHIEWEVILVDNNSSDSTKAIIDDYLITSDLNIRYVFEAQQGLSFARNTGIRQSLGQYIVFIDDDIRVTPIWLQTVYSTFQEHNCDAVGGRIHVESPQNFPKWITPDMYGFLGYQDYGPSPRSINGIDEGPFGGNMAIQRRVFDSIGYFDVNLGRKGEGLKKEELFKGEETDFFQRLAKSGGNFFYHPDALVFHKILPHQLKKRFFLTLHHNSGIQKAVADTSSYARVFWGVPLFIIPQLIRAFFRYIGLTLSNGPNNSFRQLMNVFFLLGLIAGYIKRF